jgi:phospholipid/cholesterol/gamma-HCH transport system substrate-binding protein
MKARELIAGVLFFAALGITLYFAVTLGGTGGMRMPWDPGERTYRIVFPRATGVGENAAVWVSGVPKGRVRQLYVDGETGRVTVTIRLEESIRLRSDCTAEIVASSAFGGRAISLEIGTSKEYYDEQKHGDIRGTIVDDIFTAASRSIGKLDQGIDIAIDTLKEVNATVKDVRSGKGPVGTALYDEQVADDLRGTVRNVRKISEDGAAISGDVRDITRKLNTGDGAFAMLLNDPELATRGRNIVRNIDQTSTDAAGATRSIRSIAEKIDGGKGLIGALLNDEGAGENARSILRKTDRAMDDVGRIAREGGELVAKVNRGEGSVGKLFNDDTLYNDILNTVNTLRAGFEDIREQAPITTFASLLFQAIQ